MAVSIVPHSDARVVAMRPSSRDRLGVLATAWRATQEPTVRPFSRVVVTPSGGAPLSDPGEDPPYWPDGPSAA